MVRFIVHTVGFCIGAALGEALTAGVDCPPFVVAPDGTAEALATANPMVAMRTLMDGGHMVYRCAVAGAGVELGDTGFLMWSWGLPLVLAVVGWTAARRLI